MAIDLETRKKIQELRRIEKQAKQLILKMRKLEENWLKVRKTVNSKSHLLPPRLGDIISSWSKSHA